jgi:hypothetical protein
MSGAAVFGVGLGLIAFAVVGFAAGEILLWRRRRKLADQYTLLRK